MLSKAKIKYIRALQLKKNRIKHNKFVAEGTKIVAEILNTKEIEVEIIVATSSWLESNNNFPEKTTIIEASQQEIKHISSLQTPHEVLIVATPKPYVFPTQDICQQTSLYLDAIQDPGNLGTILRIADWFGIEYVFLGEGTVDAYNSKVIQASMGAFLRVKMFPIKEGDLFLKFPHTRIIGADIQGKSIFNLSTEEKQGIIVIGNEGKGISPTLRQRIQHWVTIPAKGNAESLNAAVATGIICAMMTNN